MASAFGHAAFAFGLLKIHPPKIFTKKVLTLGVLSSAMPDIDVIAYNFGISGEHILAHRGLTHSILFGLLWASLLIMIFHRNEIHRKLLFSYYALATCSHGLLDAMTNGGDGIGLFIPFTDDRFFLPFRVLQVSPIGASNFFSDWGLSVLYNEALYIGSATIVLWIIGFFIYRQR